MHGTWGQELLNDAQNHQICVPIQEHTNTEECSTTVDCQSAAKTPQPRPFICRDQETGGRRDTTVTAQARSPP